MDTFLFVTAINSLLVTNFVIYLLCKHKILRMLVASLALQQVREVGAVTTWEEVTNKGICKIQLYIILVLTSTILGLVIFAVLHSRNIKLCRGCLFSNASKIMLFISNVQYYVQMKPFPSLQKKIEAYKGEKSDEKSLFHPNPNPFTKRSHFS